MTTETTLDKVRATYNNLDAEALEVINEFVRKCEPDGIETMRTNGLDLLIAQMRLQILSEEFEKQMKQDCKLTRPVPLSERLAIFALAWYHVNEFWLRMEVPAEKNND